MAISRNQMILDLTAPFLEKSLYKNPSQREAWGSLDLFHNSTSRYSREFLENIFRKNKEETDTELEISDREALP